MTLVSSRRRWDSEALATSSYDTYLAQPLSAATLVSAAVSVVLPWSIWPMVPTFTCGFERSNFSFAIALRPSLFGWRGPLHPAKLARSWGPSAPCRSLALLQSHRGETAPHQTWMAGGRSPRQI